MLDLSGIHIWAVVVVWLLYIVVGALWYSPLGFAKQWKKYTDIDIMKIPPNEATRTLVAVMFSAIVQSVVLAVIINSLNITDAKDGLITGVLLWLGFTAATTVGVTLYSRRSWKFWWLNSSYFLLVMSIGSVILATW